MRPAPLLAERTAERLFGAVADTLHAATRAKPAPGNVLSDEMRAVFRWYQPPRSALPERPAAPRGQLEIPGSA